MGIPDTFERIVLIRRIPFTVYWIAFGILTFILGEIAMRFFAPGPIYVWSRVIASFCFGFVPIMNVWTHHEFVRIMRQLHMSIWLGDSEYDDWLTDIESKIFTLRSFQAKSITLLIIVSGVVTVVMLGLPFGSVWINGAGLAVFSLLLWFCGQTLAISIGLLRALHNLVRKPTKAPFFLHPHPAVTELQSFYSLEALAIVMLYAMLVIAVWQGPYGINTAMLVWLSALSAYPLSMFLWSYSQIHTLLRSIKRTQVASINAEIQEAHSSAFRNNDLGSLERLEKLMGIQEKVQAVKEWPFAIGGTATFVLTLLTLVAQIVLAVSELTRSP